ncbi:MAG: hypothetical protein HYT81_02340 [Gemmatimonadetes bacterium]|nr:hypothetical protein [Gemmatimonadota bacterium]
MLSGLSVALALGLAACGGDFTSSGDSLTESEAAELAEELAEGGFVGFGGQAAAPMGAPGEAAARVTIILSDTYPCDEGGGTGTVAVAGSMTADINETTGTGTFEFNYTIAPHGCQVTTSGGKVFTLDGDPNLGVAGNFTWSQTSAEGTLTYDGRFKWEASDGRAGACGVDLTANYDFNFSSTGSSGSATVSGTVCGVTVNRTVSVDA